jgi:hypothetical protein
MTLRPTSVTVDPRVIEILRQVSELRQLRHARRIAIYAAHTPEIAARYIQVMNLSTQALEELITSLYKTNSLVFESPSATT